MPPIPASYRSARDDPPSRLLEPYWVSPNEYTKLYLGHVTDVLQKLPAKSVQCTVTSPPYWSLRDYGTGQWIGGDETCDHIQSRQPQKLAKLADAYAPRIKARNANRQDDEQINVKTYRDLCGKCGAKRVDLQIGSEPLPDCDTKGKAQCGKCFVCTILGVMRQVRRVLRDDGTVWLNLGSTFLSKPVVTDQMVLRDDLTVEERQYVLRELAKL